MNGADYSKYAQSCSRTFALVPKWPSSQRQRTLLKELYLFKEQIAERLCELAVLHQQEVAQCLKVSLHPQLHKEVVHHCLVHQRYTGDGRWGERMTKIRKEPFWQKNQDWKLCWLAFVIVCEDDEDEARGIYRPEFHFSDDFLHPVALNYFKAIHIYITVRFRGETLFNWGVSREDTKIGLKLHCVI